MAEHENRPKQDIGQDEAYIVNLKELVENTKDVRGRNRIYADAILQSVVLGCQNLTTTMGSINQSIAALAQTGATAAGKTKENMIGINETDHLVKQILNSPWAEFAKVFATAITSEVARKDED